MTLGGIGSLIAILPDEEKKYHALGREFFFKKIIAHETVDHLKTIHGKKAIDIAQHKPGKCLAIAYLINLAKKSSVVFSSIFIGSFLQQTSIFKLFPKNEQISQIFRTIFSSSSLITHSLTFAKRYRILFLTPLIFKFLSIVAEIGELILRSRKEEKGSHFFSQKFGIPSLEKMARVCHKTSQIMESVFWLRIALLILIESKNKDSDISTTIASFIKSLIPLDRIMHTISSYDTEIRSFLAKSFAFLSATVASMVIYSQTRMKLDREALDNLCQHANDFGKDLDVLMKQEELTLSSINEAYNKDLIEYADRQLLFQEIAQTIVKNVHQILHKSLLETNHEKMEQFIKRDEIAEVLNEGYPLGYANLQFTIAVYKVVKSIDEQLQKSNDEHPLSSLNFEDLMISPNDFKDLSLQVAKKELEIITDPLPQFQTYVKDHHFDFSTLSYEEQCKIRLGYLHQESNPYQTVLSAVTAISKRLSTISKNESLSREELRKIAQAYFALSSICKLLYGFELEPEKSFETFTQHHSMACLLSIKAEQIEKMLKSDMMEEKN